MLDSNVAERVTVLLDSVNFSTSLHPNNQGIETRNRRFQIDQLEDIAVDLQWFEYLWNHENMFETAVVRANES